LLKRNKPSEGKFNSPSLAVLDIFSWQHANALSQTLFVFFAEENKLIEKISMNK
jgi:hypothetical protein